MSASPAREARAAYRYRPRRAPRLRVRLGGTRRGAILESVAPTTERIGVGPTVSPRSHQSMHKRPFPAERTRRVNIGSWMNRIHRGILDLERFPGSNRHTSFSCRAPYGQPPRDARARRSSSPNVRVFEGMQSSSACIRVSRQRSAYCLTSARTTDDARGPCLSARRRDTRRPRGVTAPARVEPSDLVATERARLSASKPFSARSTGGALVVPALVRRLELDESA